jgi:choline dehydrogenase-like flavoprotein
MAKREHDIVIVGAGAGGGAAAWSLSRHGYSVLVIEAGPFYDPHKDYLLDTPGWEKSQFPNRSKHKGRYTFGEMQKLDERREDLHSWNHSLGKGNETSRRKPKRYHHMRGVGGSTLVFSGEAHRLNPASMKMKSRYGVGADWPLTYADLEPYYCQAEKVIGVAGQEGDTVRYRSEPYPLPPHSLSYGSTKIRDGAKKLGLSWRQNSVAILSEPFDGRPQCNYCANCHRGCPRSDKGSADVTFMKKALASGNCTVNHDCQVTRIEAGESDEVGAVLYVDGEGKEGIAKARVVIISCGAVETPRLLLLSQNARASRGLANESGLVGKNFLETLSFTSSGNYPESLGSYRGLSVDSICWDFNGPDGIRGVIGGCRISTGVSEADFLGPISYATRVVKGWGREHKEGMRKTFGRVLTVGAMGESLPNEKSYIDLDPREKDELGLPAARINSYVDDMGVGRLQFMGGIVREIIDASGVEKIFEEFCTYDFFNSTHVFGTCRMGDDPESSVVNAYCRSHRWKNLFIVDGSVFPSSGGGESPSLTIEALAIRTGDRIHELEGKGEL